MTHTGTCGGIESPLDLVGDLNGNNANFVGVVTATTFSGAIVGDVVEQPTAGFARTSFFLAGTPI